MAKGLAERLAGAWELAEHLAWRLSLL